MKLAPVTCEEHARMHVVAIKGAPDIVLQLCSRWQVSKETDPQLLDKRSTEKILKANDALTQDALRVLGVAYKVIPGDPAALSPEELEKDFIFSGLVGMMDPAREEVKVALGKAKGAGIRTIMITGDYPNTAKAVAESIGLLQPGHKVLTGAQLNAIDDAQLKEEVRHTDVFARVSPEHKMRIVDALQSQRRDRGNDRRRRERRPRHQALGYRRGNGHHRHGRGKGDRRHGAHGRQLRQHRFRRGAGAHHLQQHPQVRLFPGLLQPGGDTGHFPAHRLRALAVPNHRRQGGPGAFGGHPDIADEPGDGWRAGAGAGHRKGRPGYHGPAAAPAKGTHHQPAHVGERADPDPGVHHGDPGGIRRGAGAHGAPVRRDDGICDHFAGTGAAGIFQPLGALPDIEDRAVFQ